MKKKPDGIFHLPAVFASRVYDEPTPHRSPPRSLCCHNLSVTEEVEILKGKEFAGAGK